MSALALNHYICPPGYPLTRFLDEAVAAGAPAVGLTLAALEAASIPEIRRELAARSLTLSSLNSAGFFTRRDGARRSGRDPASRRLVEAAAELGADVLCVIAGGMREEADLSTARTVIVAHSPGT